MQISSSSSSLESSSSVLSCWLAVKCPWWSEKKYPLHVALQVTFL
uniref:Uncharacterized protein n=1 Tax=Arundo donax TaxID=35708 RepID=A0A0A9AHM3_ARUDO